MKKGSAEVSTSTQPSTAVWFVAVDWLTDEVISTNPWSLIFLVDLNEMNPNHRTPYTQNTPYVAEILPNSRINHS